MSHKKSKIWSIALPLSLVFLGAVYYVRVPEVRAFVDARTPVVRNLLGRYVPAPAQKIAVRKEQDPNFARTPAPMARPPEPATPRRAPVATPAPAPTLPATDLESLAKDRARWPKTVILKNPVTFPAVLNGKIVGSLVAPAGEEVQLAAIKDDKLGLVFNGAGAYVPAEQTDLLTRLQAPR